MVRVGIIEKSPIVLRVLSDLLQQDRRFEVVLAVGDLDGFLEARETPMDVLISGWVGANGGGAEVLRQTLRLGEQAPKVAIYTGASIDAVATDAIAAGARAVIHKSTSPDRLLDSLLAVAMGRRVFPKITTEHGSERLTSRESQVLECVTQGLSNSSISLSLNISENTTKFHLRNIFGKLEVRNRTQAVAKVVERGGFVRPKQIEAG